MIRLLENLHSFLKCLEELAVTLIWLYVRVSKMNGINSPVDIKLPKVFLGVRWDVTRINNKYINI